MVSLLLAIIYLSFISLGLPDGLLGAAWPSMQPEMGVPVGAAGAVSMTIAGCTIISSLLSDRMIRRFGTGKVTAVSVAMTAAALIGFSVTREYWKEICQGCFQHKKHDFSFDKLNNKPSNLPEQD